MVPPYSLMSARIHPFHALTVLLIFVVLAVAWTWPVTARLTSRIPHDPGDPILNTWILWWNAQRVPLTAAWWDAPFWFPLEGALALSEHLLGQAVFTTPMLLAGAGPVTAYNVSLLLSCALSGFFTYLLIQRLTGSVLAAACAASAYALAPYRADQLAHLQVLSSQWMPAALLGVHGYLEQRRVRWLALFAVAWLLQALSNGYYLLFFPVLLASWLGWFVRWRTAPRPGLAIVTTWAVASLPLLPVLLTYHAVHERLGLSRNLEEIRGFSATLLSFASPPALLALWPAGTRGSAEAYLFPGVTIVLLVIAGVAALIWRAPLAQAFRDRSPLLFYAAAAIVMFAMTFGPGGEEEGPPSLLRPYAWLLWLPGYDGLRVPARFAMLGALCLAVAGGFALALLLERRSRWRMALACAAIAGVTVEGWIESMPLVPIPQRLPLELPAAAAVLELPPESWRVNLAAMFRSIYHRRVLVNGFSGYGAYHYAIVIQALWRGDPSVLRYFARDRPLVVVVNHEEDPRRKFRDLIEGLPDARPLGVTGAGTMFLLPPAGRPVAWIGGTPLLPATLDDAPARGFRRLTYDFGRVRAITGFEFPLRDRNTELEGRLLVEASDDGAEWREVWLDWTGEFAIDAALEDPVVAPVRIPLPATHTRYVRLYPAASWMAEELRFVGQ